MSHKTPDKNKVILLIVIATFGMCTVIFYSHKDLRQWIMSSPSWNASKTVNNVNNIGTQIKVDTSKWLTYQDKQHGVVIKYPESWNIQATTTNAELSPMAYSRVFAVLLKKKNTTIIIGYQVRDSLVDSHILAVTMENIANYKSFNVGGYIVSRELNIRNEEGQYSSDICHIKTNENNQILTQGGKCEDSIKTPALAIGFRYLYDTFNADGIDLNLIEEADSILQQISFN